MVWLFFQFAGMAKLPLDAESCGDESLPCLAEPDGFAVVVDRYKQPLLNYIAYRIGDRHGSEDILQEVFLRAFEAILKGQFQGRSSIKTWLFAIAGYCIVDHHRKTKRRPVVFESQLNPSAKQAYLKLHQENSDPSLTLIQSEQFETIGLLLAQLPDQQQRVISLKVFGELKFRQIAELEKCSIGTVQSRMRYGLMKLGQLLQAKGADCG